MGPPEPAESDYRSLIQEATIAMAFPDEDFELGDEHIQEAVTKVAPAPPPAFEPPVGLERISEMLANPEVPIANIRRAIALEIAGVIRKMTEDRPLRYRRPRRHFNDEIKAYRELQRTLTESDALSNKDTLNLDGPKFKFLFTEMIRLFRQALQEAGVDHQLAHNTMLQFGDLVKVNEENLRRELNTVR
jgi:hypothetical protein